MQVEKITATNPFAFARPLDLEDLVDREAELALLAERCEAGVNTSLSGPRNYGKTSLLHPAIADARDAGVGAVLIDLYGVRTAGQMAARIELAYKTCPPGPFARRSPACAGVGRGSVCRHR